MCLKSRYQSTGTPSDLDASVPMISIALNIPRKDEGDQEYLKMLPNYGLILRLLFHRTRDLEDFNRALGAMTAAHLLMTDQPESRASITSNLVLMHWERYSVTEDRGDIDPAVRYKNEGLAEVLDKTAYSTKLT
ncbi:unnamed protein product [Cyclocybe aegerita]|uniref:Uncharacterized protein n=1 Tax=Cyclocybe aegerita TaxID=1973307 RepID=A0A8S0X386_CYCAE|nr:unnamed protein product [Cyclocybe aegerita]